MAAARDIERCTSDASVVEGYSIGSSSEGEEAPAFPVQQLRRRAILRTVGLATAGLAFAGGAAALLVVVTGPASGHGRTGAGVRGGGVASPRPEHVIGFASVAEAAKEAKKTTGKANCNVTHTCASPGMQCYEQNANYAQCRGDCTPGPDPTHWDGQPWSCKTLGERTSGKDECTWEGQDCRANKCCQQPGYACYEKSEVWATCKATCQPGPNFADGNGLPWSCKKLGPTTDGAAPWVQGQCSAGAGQNCISTGCCKNGGEQCYKKNDYYGECRAACTEPGWSCDTIGSRTPAQAPKSEIAALPEWAFTQCSKPEQGCKTSGCCIGMDVQCYEKDDFWAQCKSSCTPGPHADDKNATWSCKAIGPRAYGVSKKGFPSLYCFSVIRTTGYEVGLMQAQFAKGAGIFACDDYNLLSADGTVNVGTVTSLSFPGAPITVSVDNTAGNTELFVHAWQRVVSAGTWRQHTFTLKVDPDAVMLPDRVRTHLRPHVGEKMFIINCPFGDMIFGALEVFSYHAILAWEQNGRNCAAPNNWGEDKYMTHCMDTLGVARVHDVPILADNLCLGSDCGNGVAAAFHPYKDVGSWMQCWSRATSPQVTVRK